jgi:hypothetical protein
MITFHSEICDHSKHSFRMIANANIDNLSICFTTARTTVQTPAQFKNSKTQDYGSRSPIVSSFYFVPFQLIVLAFS